LIPITKLKICLSVKPALTITQVERFFVLKMSKNAGRANPDAGNQEAGELA
jgi:hypothetical protein